ncbi:MAG: hypothetical protein LUQ16_03170 [Methanomassiliicoccales archaeon]|nr:hypothetical protein [Methanomassiliicoccales archaeon]
MRLRSGQDELTLSQKARGEETSEGREWKRFLVTVAFVTIGVLLLIPLLDWAIREPVLLWIAMLLILLASALIILSQVYPRHLGRSLLAEEERATLTGNRRRGGEWLGFALSGSQHYQMLAYLELRDALVRRYMILHRLSREQAETTLSDWTSAKSILGDDGLVWLLTLDFKRAYDHPEVDSEAGKRMVKEFPVTFPILLTKVEALR